MREIRFQIWKKTLSDYNKWQETESRASWNLVDYREGRTGPRCFSCLRRVPLKLQTRKHNLVEGTRELIWVNTKVKHIHFLWGLCITQFSNSMRPLQFLSFLGFFHFIELVPKPYKYHLCRENSGVKKAIIRMKNSRESSNIKWWKCQRYEK